MLRGCQRLCNRLTSPRRAASQERAAGNCHEHLQAEELNLIVEGRHYGWPHVYGKKIFNPQYYGTDLPPDLTKEKALERAESPKLELPAHSAPMAMLFYDASHFPTDFRHHAFAALHGSWNRKNPVGYKVIRIVFRDGKPVRTEDFLSGFLVDNGRGYFGRPVGLAVTKEGALLVSDDANGVIYRVTHTASARRTR